MRTFPEGSKEVHVYASQWKWEFEYKNGLKSTNKLVVPIGTPVKLIMTSKDVLHSFYVPSFRVKQDVVPGRYTALVFESKMLGDFHIFCTEYCGTAHSNMLGTLKVVSLADYEKYLAGEATGDLAGGNSPGEKLYNDKGCVACHSVDGSRKVGPTLKALFGRQTEFEEGAAVKADENYIRESILDPKAKTVKSYPAGVMPAFQGQLSEEDLTALIEFIKSKSE
jgi:cytochrome c oxidase subunit 2